MPNIFQSNSFVCNVGVYCAADIETDWLISVLAWVIQADYILSYTNNNKGRAN